MAVSTFNADLDFVLEEEGGYVDDPRDPGGATNHGITQRTYTAYLRALGVRPQPVKDITTMQVRSIYSQIFYKCGGSRINSHMLTAILFDTAVLCGVVEAVKLLQTVLNGEYNLNLTVDGRIGPLTLNALGAIKSYPDAALDLLDGRWEHLKHLINENSTLAVFEKGWYGRVVRLAKYVGLQWGDTAYETAVENDPVVRKVIAETGEEEY